MLCNLLTILVQVSSNAKKDCAVSSLAEDRLFIVHSQLHVHMGALLTNIVYTKLKRN